MCGRSHLEVEAVIGSPPTLETPISGSDHAADRRDQPDPATAGLLPVVAVERRLRQGRHPGQSGGPCAPVGRGLPRRQRRQDRRLVDRLGPRGVQPRGIRPDRALLRRQHALRGGRHGGRRAVPGGGHGRHQRGRRLRLAGRGLLDRPPDRLALRQWRLRRRAHAEDFARHGDRDRRPAGSERSEGGRDPGLRRRLDQGQPRGDCDLHRPQPGRRPVAQPGHGGHRPERRPVRQHHGADPAQRRSDAGQSRLRRALHPLHSRRPPRTRPTAARSRSTPTWSTPTTSCPRPGTT